MFIEPGWSVVRTNFADFLREEGDDERGEKLIRDGLERDPDDAMLHHALGLLLVRSGRSDAAIESLGAAARLEKDNSRYSYVFGVALNSMGRSDEAARTLAEAYEKHPGSFDIAWAIATARAVLAAMRIRFPANPDVEALARQLAVSPSG